nr:PREDICTED: uncharacterized protein LOC108221484 [Daucus carota subsp. sativus]
MSNFTKLEFEALDITGKNYLSWILDIEIHLAAQGLGNTIKEENQETESNRAKAMIFLRRHLHEALKSEYLTVKNPLELWKSLKDRYDHQKTVILPKARYDWMHLRLQDFKTNHESRPTGSRPFPEANAATYNYGRGRGGGRGRSGNRGRGRGRGFARGQGTRGRGYKIHNYPIFKNDTSNPNPKLENNINKDKGKGVVESTCYRCGVKGHWSRTCRTPKHLVELYQASLKDKGKNVETNLVCGENEHADDLLKMTYLDAADFYENPTTLNDN